MMVTFPGKLLSLIVKCTTVVLFKPHQTLFTIHSVSKHILNSNSIENQGKWLIIWGKIKLGLYIKEVPDGLNV